MKESTRLTEKLKQRDFKLNALLDLTMAINANASVSELLHQYEQVLRKHLEVSKLLLFTKEVHWTCVLKYGVAEGEIYDVTDESFFSTNDRVTFAMGPDNEAFDIIVPILQDDKPIAYLLVGDQVEQEIRMSPVVKHMKYIQTLTNVLVTAIRNRQLQQENVRQEIVRKELELAAEMQAILLPHHLPSNEHYDVAAFYKAHQQVGGDYYDFLELNDNEVMFCMADVSGKGVSAAFLMANFQAYLRSIFAYRNGDLTEIIRELNDRVINTAMGEKYITLFLAIYKRSTRMLSYVNCGHNPPVLVDANGYTQFLKHGTVGIGMFDELPKVVEGEVKLGANSVIVCFTDGLVETENESGEPYGEERLEKLVLSYFNDSMSDLNDVILESVNEFSNEEPYRDDLAILSCRFY
jgi:sigma-B regulation protein RsbU (phosphoserine phosphatase)